MLPGLFKKNGLFLILTFLFVFLGSSVPVPAETELDHVRNSIRQRRAQWTAEETAISRLPSAQRRGLLGLNKAELRKDHSTAPVLAAPSSAAVAALPTGVDWTDYNYVTPVKNQGSCGSCWAFATVAALESQVAIGTSTIVNLSEQVLVSCSGAGNCSQGGYIDRASNFIRDTGLPIEECFPYTATNNTCDNAACSNWSTDTFRINGWHWVATTSPTATAIKNALNTYGPLVTTMNVYTDFYSYRSGIYSQVSGVYEGGHAIELVGYDDSAQCFIAKNSWGTGWGEAGFFRIGYNQIDSAVEFGDFTMAYDGYRNPPANCGYSVYPTTGTFGSSGGSGSMSVTATTGCSWSATANATWIKITSGASGTGNGTVGYTVSANTGTAKRTGTISVAGQTYTITQDPAAVQCTYSISPTSRTVAASGGNASISVTASSSSCAWTAVSNASWIKILSGASGSGSGTVSYSVSANTATQRRTGTVTVAGKTFTLTQSAAAAQCTYSISPTSRTVGASGGNASITVTASSSSCAWTAVSNASWITVTSGASRTGSGTVTYRVAVNTATQQRTGTISVAGKTFTVTQAKAASTSCTYAISPVSRTLRAAGAYGNIGVTTGSTCSWTATSNVSWIQIVSGASGTGNGSVRYLVTPNTTGKRRSGTVNVGGKSFTVLQYIN